jgi:hypothetical protein
LLLTLLLNTGAKADAPVADTTKLPSGLGPAPGTYELAEDRDTIVLPLEYYGMNLMVKARMNGVDIKILIDNGVMWDELFFYGSDQVDSLGMHYQGDVHVEGAGEGEGVDSYTASGVSISFGDLTFHGQDAVITAKEQGFADYFPGIAGQVCGTFFKHFIVEFDFDKMELLLHKPGSFRPQGHGSAVPMQRDESGAYSIPVRITAPGQSEVATNLFIDLGGIYPVSLVVGGKDGLKRPSTDREHLGYGASGEITGYKSRLSHLKIADFDVKDVEAVFTDSGRASDHTNTTIGLALLHRFNLVFDYLHQKLYLQPNRSFAGEDEKGEVDQEG